MLGFFSKYSVHKWAILPANAAILAINIYVTIHQIGMVIVVSLPLCLLLSTTNYKKFERSTWEGNYLFSK